MSSVLLTPFPNTIPFIYWICEVACQFYSVAISANPMLGAYFLGLAEKINFFQQALSKHKPNFYWTPTPVNSFGITFTKPPIAPIDFLSRLICLFR